MTTLNDLTVETLETVQTELRNFFTTRAYEVIQEVLVGKNTLLEKEVILSRPETIADILNREAAIGEARESAKQIDFLSEFLVEVTETLQDKLAPSH